MNGNDNDALGTTGGHVERVLDGRELTINDIRRANHAFVAFLNDNTQLPAFVREKGFSGQFDILGSLSTVLLGTIRHRYSGEDLLPEAASTLGEVKERIALIIPKIIEGFKSETIGQYSGVIGDPDKGQPLHNFTDEQWGEIAEWVDRAFDAGIQAAQKGKGRENT